MALVKKTKEMVETPEVKPQVKSYSKFKGKPVVFISGNFMRGGFSTSKSKIAAILDNREELEKFVRGDYDKDIEALGENEVLELEAQ